jgi:hypothetical protein
MYDFVSQLHLRVLPPVFLSAFSKLSMFFLYNFSSFPLLKYGQLNFHSILFLIFCTYREPYGLSRLVWQSRLLQTL